MLFVNSNNSTTHTISVPVAGVLLNHTYIDLGQIILSIFENPNVNLSPQRFTVPGPVHGVRLLEVDSLYGHVAVMDAARVSRYVLWVYIYASHTLTVLSTSTRLALSRQYVIHEVPARHRFVRQSSRRRPQGLPEKSPGVPVSSASVSSDGPGIGVRKDYQLKSVEAGAYGALAGRGLRF
ncbi:hypothetical protein EXIGLDRAFT_783905 [Exidia glandulosa HHB12029]|uniref:Uncharacterized protein n=1 Tax=Exidia glandulosa HHB12029 TaxID=1314781 RepID=A0A166MPQ9_EXIGL|nr:hypothetical protein EXIGLDRAFT_784088 [Exidia glandulosa HHB12029]KZV78385.1 hypothetical protein EXIGLDRAFT_783905 [Exidia glandulosa HHB12029]